MKMVMQVSYAWLVAFYWMLTPLVAPMAIVPQTCGVFLGWLKTYVSVALWPMFLRLRGATSRTVGVPGWVNSTAR